MRKREELARDIDRFTLESRGIPALRAHIRANWTIDEILSFNHYTRCGTFSPPSGAWLEYVPGYIASTAQGMRNLVALFYELQAEAWFYMGAFSARKSDAPPEALICDNHELGGFTLCGIVGRLPDYLSDILNAIKDDVAFLAKEERRRTKRRKDSGKKAAHARKEAEEGAEKKPYAQRIKEALDQVEKKVADGMQVLEACRSVCKHYGEKKDPKTGEIIFKGGLNKMNGEPMPPETLRDYYRKRRKGKRKNK